MNGRSPISEPSPNSRPSASTTLPTRPTVVPFLAWYKTTVRVSPGLMAVLVQPEVLMAEAALASDTQCWMLPLSSLQSNNSSVWGLPQFTLVTVTFLSVVGCWLYDA